MIAATTPKKDKRQRDADDPPVVRKRGRKPKGGVVSEMDEFAADPFAPPPAAPKSAPNIILHLCCFMKDLEAASAAAAQEPMDVGAASMHGGCELLHAPASFTAEEKIDELANDFHANVCDYSEPCCFWDTCDFKGTVYELPQPSTAARTSYGCFCSPQCAVAYLMNSRLSSTEKFEQLQLFMGLYFDSSLLTESIKPAPDPRYLLKKYHGTLTIEQYRDLFDTGKVYLFTGKPLTRTMPDLHVDNDDFMLLRKVIQSHSATKQAKRPTAFFPKAAK
jgi:hypothetical protein